MNNLYLLVDGLWVSWSTWSQCSATCGSGTQFRTRKCLFIPSGAPHGKNCTGLGSDQQTCNTNACPGKQCSLMTDE